MFKEKRIEKKGSEEGKRETKRGKEGEGHR